MKVPFSWLKELVDIDVTAQELEEKLFSCGFEVEELIPLDAGISKVVVGENQTFMGEEELLRARGVEITLLQDPTCIALMRDFIASKPELWNEDIGEPVA